MRGTEVAFRWEAWDRGHVQAPRSSVSLIPRAWLLSPYSLVTFKKLILSPLSLLWPVIELTQLIVALMIEKLF